MSWWRRWRKRDQDLDDEIRTHLSMAAQVRIDRGEAPEEAARAARRELGNELLIREETREKWSLASLQRSIQDLRYVLRQMRRSLGFTAVAVVTLALGLGATTAMFSIVNGVLLRPLQYRDPARLYMVQTVVAPRFHAATPWPVNARHFDVWRKHGRSWDDIALVDGYQVTLTGKDEPLQIPIFAVSNNFFRTLGVKPALGRDFRPEEELPGHSVVILADSLWRTRFAADPSVVGQTIVLNDHPNLVIGVMPPGLRMPKGDEWGTVFTGPSAPVMFGPLGFDVSQGRASGAYNFGSIMRLKRDVSRQQAIAEMNALIADMVRQFHIESKPGLTKLQTQVTLGVHSALWLLMGTVGAVLLIVCVNIGNLMLIRTSSRYREAGLRLALGASRPQLFGLVLKEAAVLVAMGGALGLLVAFLGLGVFQAAAPVSLPRIDEVRIDWQVVAFSFGAMLFSTLLCGLVPAWKLSRIAPQESLKAGAMHNTGLGRRLRAREFMVGVEVALSTLLLVVGGLLMVSFFRVMRSDKGIEVSHVITQDFSLTGPGYTRERRLGFVESAMREMQNIPGVESASYVDQVPLRGESAVCGLRDADRLADPAHPESALNFAGLASYHAAAPNYWRVMGIPLKSGRTFEPGDRKRRVAVVSQRLASLLWGNQDPIGRHVMSCGSSREPTAALEVIGVVGETRASPERESPVTVYQPHWDFPIGGGSFVVRTRSDPAAVAGSLRRVLRSLDSGLPLPPAGTMQQILEESVAARRFEMYLAVAFAFSALLLASLGIYGIVSFSVARRTPEIGVRLALGARPPELIAMVFREGMLPAVTGLAAGLIASLLSGRLLATQLFGVTPRDPLTISIVTLLLLAVAACACLVPARRATRIDPVRALRFE